MLQGDAVYSVDAMETGALPINDALPWSEGSGAFRTTWHRVDCDTDVPTSVAPRDATLYGSPVDMSSFSRFGVWLHSPLPDDEGKSLQGANFILTMESVDCESDGWDYYFTRPITIDWDGWKWLSVSLVDPGQRETLPTDTTFPLYAQRSPLGMDAIFTARLAFDGVADDTNATSVGGALSIGTAAVFSGAIEDASLALIKSSWDGGTYERKYQVTLQEHWRSDDIIVFPETDLPPYVSWSSSRPSEDTIQICLSLQESELALLVVEQGLLNPIFDIVMGLTVSGSPITLDSVHLQFAAPLGGAESALLRRSAFEAGHTMAWASLEDYERVILEAEGENWKNDHLSELRDFSDSWPASHVQRWASVSVDENVVLPPHGGQSLTYYPLACEDGSVPTVDTTASVIACRDNVQGVNSEKWPAILWQMQHDELADAVYKLGLAFQLFKDPDIAIKVWDILEQYGEAYPMFTKHNVDTQPGEEPEIVIVGGKVTSSNLEESVWLRKMVLGFDCVRSHAPNTDIRASVENNLFRTGVTEVLLSHNSYGNHQSFQNMAMVSIGLALDDWVLLRYAVDAPNGALLGGGSVYFQIENLVLSGGFWFEGSFVYHLVALQPLLETAQDLQRLGIDLYSHSEGALTQMALAPLLVVMPDYALPPVNDALRRSFTSYGWLYELVHANIEDQRIDFLLSPENRRFHENFNGLLFGKVEIGENKIQPPILESVVLEAAGFGVLRTQEKSYALIDFGPHGGAAEGHGHLDKLGLITYALGEERGHDPGTVAYSIPSHYTWDKSTVSHNTVVCDMQNQLMGDGHLLSSHVIGPAPMIAAASPNIYNEVSSYQRTNVLTSEYLLDVFVVESSDASPRLWDWVYHDRSNSDKSRLHVEVGVLYDHVWEVREGETASLHDNSSDLSNIFDGAASSAGYQHITERDSYVGDGKAWDIVFNSPVPLKTYEDFVLKPAGTLGYVAGTGMDGDAQSASWAALESNFSAIIQLNVDFNSCSEQIETNCRSQLLLSNTGDSIPTDSVPSSVTLFMRSSGARAYIRLIDAVGKYFTKALPVSTSDDWSRVDTSSEAVRDWSADDFTSPLQGIAVQIFHDEGEEKMKSVFLADLTVHFEDNDAMVIWSPIDPEATADLKLTGTRLLVGAEPTTTRVITGVGLGIDRKVGLEDPVPMVVLRRESKSSVFNVLHEFWRGFPGSAVTSFEQVPSTPSLCPQRIHRIGGKGWEDWIVLSPLGASEEKEGCSNTVGHDDFEVTVPADASYFYLRLGEQGQLMHLSTSNVDGVVQVFEITGVRSTDVDISWDMNRGEIHVAAALPEDGPWALKVLLVGGNDTTLFINGIQTDFVVAGGFAIRDNRPSGNANLCRNCSGLNSYTRSLLFARVPCCVEGAERHLRGLAS